MPFSLKSVVISERLKMKQIVMPDLETIHHFDVIIVGSGGAGLSLALSLPSHYNIAILAKAALTEASTFYAQGGVAAVLDETDSIQQHINDTMSAVAHVF